MLLAIDQQFKSRLRRRSIFKVLTFISGVLCAMFGTGDQTVNRSKRSPWRSCLSAAIIRSNGPGDHAAELHAVNMVDRPLPKDHHRCAQQCREHDLVIEAADLKCKDDGDIRGHW